MFCPKCHSDIQDSKNFCPRCGEELNKKKKNYNFSHINKFSNISTFNYKNDIKELEDKIEEDTKNIEITEKKDENINKNDHNESHESQDNYSRKYSNVQKSEHNISHNDQYNYSYEYSNMSNETINSDEDYIKAYVGSYYNQLKNEQFNIFALLFGPLYLIYRKLYFKAFIIIFLEFILQNIYSPLNTFISLVINIYLSLNFKKIYFNEVEKKVSEIRTLNENKTSAEIIKILSKKGGTIELS